MKKIIITSLAAIAAMFCGCEFDFDVDANPSKLVDNIIDSIVECDVDSYESVCSSESMIVECIDSHVILHDCPNNSICDEGRCVDSRYGDVCDASDFEEWCTADGVYACEGGTVGLFECEGECIDGECIPN